MRVVEVRRYGGPEVVGEAERPDPRPQAGRVLVRVAAAEVNPVDLGAREGLVRAVTPGSSRRSWRGGTWPARCRRRPRGSLPASRWSG